MADVNADDEVVGNFCSITGSTPEQARFYLDSAAGDLSAAMDSFYGTCSPLTPHPRGSSRPPHPHAEVPTLWLWLSSTDPILGFADDGSLAEAGRGTD